MFFPSVVFFFSFFHDSLFVDFFSFPQTKQIQFSKDKVVFLHNNKQ